MTTNILEILKETRKRTFSRETKNTDNFADITSIDYVSNLKIASL